ncbi:cell division protein ZipA C-terminal FtsZ-binding domain-containing protein [Succinimonas amylolytica]|uniref:cell division protein ZipA C-terminal FtsZ-binding domain-containing protein n=1 Tax=Succinimonas amylolytica TaxID=83769 RepID=UPI00036CC37D|nr:cell division protein ZipA C-terminal FtsZ-binding domain-containing protein [Succinimonas amylolytica]
MPGISLLVIVIGLIALTVYLATGFLQGRQNRKPLERDSITESTAKALSPLTDEEGVQEEGVRIIEERETVKVPVEEFTENSIAPDNSVEASDDNNRGSGNSMAKLGFLYRLKNFLSGSDSSSTRTNEEEASTPGHPEDFYQFNIIPEDQNGMIPASLVSQLCDKYHFEQGEHDVYEYRRDGRTLFTVCGNKAPYGFPKNEILSLNYKAIIVSMVLPERGEAEFTYSEMSKFAYILCREVGGKMVDNQKKPFDEAIFKNTTGILAFYDAGGQ